MRALLFLCLFSYAASESVAVNPIRKVVTMLQMMQQKVTAEGEKEKELYDKYMCWCSTGASDLAASIADAEQKGPELTSAIEEAVATQKQLEEDLAQHKADRANAKKAMAEASAIREKEKAAFEKETAESRADIDAINRAVAALDKGMAGAFLQTGAAQALRRLVVSKEMQEYDRREVLSFLSNTQGYSPASGEIVGILKQMGDEMQADLADVIKAEEAAVKAYEELMAAKKKEIAALTKSIETKLVRVGELKIKIAEMKNELGDTMEALAEDKKFLADLEKNCEKKKAEWAERVKTRAEELLALADTIKVLNDDDALELFKKTLPSGASFLQMQVSSKEVRARALAAVRHVPGLDFIAMALRGKKIGFDKIIKMIDELVAALKKEQTDDDDKKEYCTVTLDEADDKKKGLERTLKQLAAAIADAEEGIETATADIKALKDSIVALDKAVAEATETRKEEHADFQALMANDGAAKEVLGWAKNRLNKFYNPKLYKPPPKRELSEADRTTVNMGGTLAPTNAPQGIAGTGIAVPALVEVHDQKVAPPPPPETFGAYSKKSQENTGVISMIDLLVKDLDKEMTEAKAEEKDAQGDYEEFMTNSKEKRAEAVKNLADREKAKADLEAALQGHKSDAAEAGDELKATLQAIQNLHNECDWLLKYFDVRKEARAGEIDALGKAKAVLSGADYSLLQRRSLRRRV